MDQSPILWVAVTFGASWVSTGIAYRLARLFGWFDHPIDRSSHVSATPTSGGIGLVIIVSISMAWLLKDLPGGVAPLIGGGLAIALVGLIDDVRSLPIAPRLFVQALGMAIALYCIGPIGQIDFLFANVESSSIVLVVAWLAGIWFINLFNFMDGIDGIASAEATFVGLLAGGLVLPVAPDLAVAWWAISGAAAGLLAWCWPPARIFMGDVGSGFLGFMIAVLLLCSLQRNALSLGTALVLVSPFVCDTTITLLRRMMRGEAWYHGHRLHAYQHLARRWGSHRRVTTASIGLNVLFIGPAAWTCSVQPTLAPLIAAVVVIVTSALVLLAGAGRREDA